MGNSLIAVLCGLLAMLASTVVYPFVLHYAIKHDIVDNPNARKLQRVPVPLLGGAVVYVGILTGCCVLALFMRSEFILWGFIGMTVMAIIGTWDDMKGLSVAFRFAVELSLVGLFIALTGVYIDDLHGLWGVHTITPWIGVPLSIVTGVGIINAVNLIDGVDGFSSGYGIMACGLFGLVFWNVWNPILVIFTMIVIGALIPFFMHNVFGQKSKMFIGDGGTLMLGILLMLLTFYTLWSKGRCDAMAVEQGVSLTALTLSFLCIPVFDTLRVMTLRILRGKSPFNPDRTHLHHLFIDMGFSHLGAAVFILFINLLVVAAWLLAWKAGASIDVQTYIVVFLGMMVTFGFYKLMKEQQNGGPCDEEGYPQGTWLWHWFRKLGNFSRREKGPIWSAIRRIMDNRFFNWGL